MNLIWCLSINLSKIATVNVLKFYTLFSFCSQIKCWFSRAGIHKFFVRVANREDPDQSDLGLPFLSRPFWQVPSVQNFRTFTVIYLIS